MIAKNLPLLKFITASLVVATAIISQIFNASLEPAGQLDLKPVLAFEFARNMDDIRTLFFTQGTPAHQFIKDIRYSIQIDFFFIVAYAAFMALLAIELRPFSKPLALIALVLAIIGGVFDTLENIEMLGIASWAAGNRPIDGRTIIDQPAIIYLDKMARVRRVYGCDQSLSLEQKGADEVFGDTLGSHVSP